jgi:tetratricopeptide (TPR) repeat protein
VPDDLSGGGFDGRDPAEAGEGRLAPQAIRVVFKATINSVAAWDSRAVTWSLGNLANEVSAQGDFGRAKGLYEEGLVSSRALGGAEMLGAYLISLGYGYLLEGDLERATVLNEEALELLRKRDRKSSLHVVLDNLG